MGSQGSQSWSDVNMHPFHPTGRSQLAFCHRGDPPKCYLVGIHPTVIISCDHKATDMDFGGQPRWSSCIRCSEDTDSASSGWRIHPSSFSGQSGISVQEGPSPAREKQPGRGTGKKPCPNECSEEQSSYFSFSYFSCAWPRRLAHLSC